MIDLHLSLHAGSALVGILFGAYAWHRLAPRLVALKAWWDHRQMMRKYGPKADERLAKLEGEKP